MDGATFRLRGRQLQPASSDQTIEQAACLFGIKPAAERLTPDVQQRYLRLPACPNPTQCAAGVGMLLRQPDLPERCSAMRPEIISPQPHSGLNVSFTDQLRLRTTEHRPIQIGECATQP